MNALRILIDILHPAHVHFFRNAILQWDREHEILITSRGKDIATDLLDAYDLPHQVISNQVGNLLGLGQELIIRDYALGKIVKKFKPDVLTGVAGVCASHIGKLLRVPSVIFYDTEKATLINALTHPFATTVYTPECYQTSISGDHRRYVSYHELAYLHPNRFKSELKFIKPLACLPGSYFILRFVSHNSSHDRKQDGLSNTEKIALVENLKHFGKVFISSEPALPDELQAHILPTEPKAFHHILANARMVIGESATVCSEAAMLGVPSVYLSTAERGYITELSEKYGLVQILDPRKFESSMNLLNQILKDSLLKERIAIRNEIMLKDKIDLTEIIIRAVEEAASGLTRNPEELVLRANG